MEGATFTVQIPWTGQGGVQGPCLYCNDSCFRHPDEARAMGCPSGYLQCQAGANGCDNSAGYWGHCQCINLPAAAWDVCPASAALVANPSVAALGGFNEPLLVNCTYDATLLTLPAQVAQYAAAAGATDPSMVASVLPAFCPLPANYCPPNPATGAAQQQRCANFLAKGPDASTAPNALCAPLAGATYNYLRQQYCDALALDEVDCGCYEASRDPVFQALSTGVPNIGPQQCWWKPCTAAYTGQYLPLPPTPTCSTTFCGPINVYIENNRSTFENRSTSNINCASTGGGSVTFLGSYWWVAVVAVVIAILVFLFFLLRK